MSIDDFGDDVFFKWLDNCTKFFRANRIEMEETAQCVDNIIKMVKTSIQKIDKDNLQQLFKTFQNSIITEFSQKGEYENKIIVKLQDQWRICMKKYLVNTQNAFETSKRYERMKQRMNSSHNVETLRFLVTREPKVDVEKRFIGLSYAYANLISGIFRFTLQDCYTWEKVSNDENVNPDTIVDMDVPDFYNYYKQKNDLLYFEGFDPIVRNAVAHSHFEYDPITQKMTYVNEGKKEISPTGTTSSNRQTVTHSYEQMVENYKKIEKIYESIMITNQVLMVSTCLAKFTERHS